MNWNFDHIPDNEPGAETQASHEAQDRLWELSEEDVVAEAKAIIKEYYEEKYWLAIGGGRSKVLILLNWRWKQAAMNLGFRRLEAYSDEEEAKCAKDVQRYEAEEAEGKDAEA